MTAWDLLQQDRLVAMEICCEGGGGGLHRGSTGDWQDRDFPSDPSIFVVRRRFLFFLPEFDSEVPRGSSQPVVKDTGLFYLGSLSPKVSIQADR